METDELYMHRALQLALLGQGTVAPNPLVGCVIVHPSSGVIGEGWHKKFGGPHAEVNAVQSVANQDLLQDSTAYVSLEPCSHFGKTPPCAELLVKHRFKRVVICHSDPNPLVAGRGIQMLREAGIEVKTGVLEEEGKRLNRFFLTAHLKKRPFVTLKWAMTSDNFIARHDGSSKWISGPESRLKVHQWRACHQAILVGRNTLRTDDPQLNVRNWVGPNPIRVVVDPQRTLPPDLNVFTDSGSPTWVFGLQEEGQHGHIRSIRFQNPDSGPGEVLAELFEKGVHSLFVEGGSRTIQRFIDLNLWDEALVFTAPVRFETGVGAPILHGGRLIQNRFSGSDLLQHFEPSTGS